MDYKESVKSWDELNLKEDLLRGIYAHGFEEPSPIQSRAIRPIVDGRDVIGQAQSGTGKTGAFTTSAIQLIDPEKEELQCLIMAPTRELATQIHKVLTDLGTFVTYINAKLFVGGKSMEDDISSLRDKPKIAVGTPGRIHDLMRRKQINGQTIKTIYLDEADEMLSAGFKEQIYNIFHYLGTDVQVCLFSATLPEEIHILTEKFMRDPVKILVKADAVISFIEGKELAAVYLPGPISFTQGVPWSVVMGDADNDGDVDLDDLIAVLDNLKEKITDRLLLRIISMWKK